MVAVIILVAFVLKRIISKYASAIIFKLGKAQWSGMAKPEFDKYIVTPLERILMAIVIILSLDNLHFPQALLFTVHKTTTSRDVIDSLTSVIVILCITSLLVRFIDYMVMVIQYKTREKTRESSLQLLFFFKDLIRVIIIIFGILFILKYSFHVDIGTVLTGLSIVGAALALAAKESLENLIASFIIFFDKPFETGDFIKVNNITGNIERIGLRSTRVRTAARSLVTIPNKQMVDSVLDNWSERNQVRNELKSFLSPETPSDKLSQAVERIRALLAASGRILNSEVHLMEVTHISATILVVFYTKTGLSNAEANDLTQYVNIGLRKIQEELGIRPADSTNLTVSNSEPRS